MNQEATPELAVNALEEELAEAAAFCREEAVGLEVTAFADPAHLDAGFAARLEEHGEALDGVAPVLVHGPYLDLYPTSPDPEIVAVARERHERALEAAAALEARIYVAHLNSIPLISNRDYRDRFVGAAAAFWREHAPRAVLVAESDRLEANRRSLAALRGLLAGRDVGG